MTHVQMIRCLFHFMARYKSGEIVLQNIIFPYFNLGLSNSELGLAGKKELFLACHA